MPQSLAKATSGLKTFLQGDYMRIARLLVVATTLAIFSGVAMADTDPAIGIKGGGGSQVLTGPNFSFTFVGGTSQEQDFDFINSTGFTALELDLIAPGSPDPGSPPISGFLSYACADASTYYGSCQTSSLANGDTLFRYFGGAGIPNDPNPSCSEFGCTSSVAGADFLMFVQDVQGDLASLPSTDSFTVNATLLPTVPEPATLLLLSAGLGVLGFSRRRNKQAA
jgi:hypothetical protein